MTIKVNKQSKTLLPSQLPNELLILLSAKVSPQDRHACMNVCHSWRTAFYHLSFISVQIYTRNRLLDFIKDLLQNKTTKYSFGDCIRELRLYKTGITQDDLKQLEYFCPGLEILDFDPKMWLYFTDHTLIGRNWKSLSRLPVLTSVVSAQILAKTFKSSLAHLEFDGSIIDSLSFIDNIIPLIRSLPLLTHLSLTCSFTQLSLEGYENIHLSLPHLQSLLLNGFLLTLTDQDKVSLAHLDVPVFRRLRKLSLTANLESPAWLSLILKQYPELESFEANLSFEESSFEQEAYFQVNDVFLFAATKWNRLSLFILSGMIQSAWPGRDFLKCLDEAGSRLEIYRVTRYDNESMDEEELANIIRYTHSSLTSLSLSVSSEPWYPLSNTSTITQKLSNMLCLTDLNISSTLIDGFTTCSIDTLLDDCPVLIKLTIAGGFVTACERDLFTEHPLKTLNMIYIYVDPHVFKHISRRCPKLSKLYLSHCIKESGHMPSLSFSIDMPIQEFSSIKIDSLSATGDFSLACHPRSSIFSLVQLKKKKGQSIRWYHETYSANNTHVRRLSLKKLKAVKEYVRSASAMMMPVPYTRWKQFERNLWYGHVDICCRSVKRLIIDGVLV
ncbi:hypothetical protein J3Q64DRAFT_1721456 [Phycomyces blakesleeanus]|uniref:F-box domain-containing protein n=2 Tax=Phycomyces blakesleeanus TaxID=4837 RepID=A0A167NXQ9_PHYB8|nr:hypothetical protein PHYBLDRAFT_165340 [Phycomyces blakesleeanus NRRL 1555(-)]OAD76838.1 hypothetical protein PHYBLDRAFT_165340 [Phycomyces blakesleeanus NRRL 1555(-)]|eukprot:XP_018294878.1 hypothetical protein PHYBLDRAFT_165340 [Phycomyces blakesleeanus NRRL 1555(-)]